MEKDYIQLDFIPIKKGEILPSKDMIIHYRIETYDLYKYAFIDHLKFQAIKRIIYQQLSDADCVIILEDKKVVKIINKGEEI